MSDKKISFVMPVFNDVDSLEKAVRSIRDQDLPDIEMIVVNDGSTDGSKEIIDALAEQKLIDKHLHFEQNRGACVARNEGTKLATGKYISFLPADAILYPGVARTWYETLEDFPDYDFLYGGYRLVDGDGEPIPGQDYFFGPFEPYLLDVGNYIDGSFPIRRESYWKFAKAMYGENADGLWDPSIKSLQDWDFWLSVVKHGGKGVYMQDIFFGTTPPHKGGLSDDSSKNWLERTEAIKRKHGIPIRTLCVASLGAAFHAKRMAWLLDADFKEMPSFKPHRYSSIYVVGFYPEFAAQQDQMFWNNIFDVNQGRTPAKKVVHFVGSDIWQFYHMSLRALEVWKNYFKHNVDEVLVEAEFTHAELKKILDIDAKIVPIPPMKLFEVKPMPKDFTVACYQPHINENFYRPQEMMEIAKKMPEVKFKFFGDPRKSGQDPNIPNVEHCGYVSNMEEFIAECSAVMRFPFHDGLPISVLEFLVAGRYSVQSVPIKYTAYLPEFNVETAVNALQDIQKMAGQPNEAAAAYWRQELDHGKFLRTIYKLAGYNPKEYWENRAKGWAEQVMNMAVEKDDIKPLFEKAKEIIGKGDELSVLDIGCGDGRWYPILKDWRIGNYYGIDISENLIKAAQMRFPHLQDSFSAVKVEDFHAFEDKKFDLIFSYTCLEHITEPDFPKAVETIKKSGNYLLLIEPEGFISRYYCHDHDYRKYFEVIQEIKLQDKIVLLCKL